MSSRDRPRNDDLEERLDELEGVLSELRSDLRASERDRRGLGSSRSRRSDDPGRKGDPRREPERRRDRSPDLPRPPRLSELVRFTEQYTIPTVIALLETTIKSLKLVQGTLRLLDPDRDLNAGTETTAGRLADVRDGAADGLARSLSELRTALAEADLPEEAASRSIIEEARDLTAEIEARIEEGRRQVDDARQPSRRDGSDRGATRGDTARGSDRREAGGRRDGGRTGSRRDGAVHIDVSDPDEGGTSASGADADASADATPDDPPEVDVESELDSIKRQLDAVEEDRDVTDDASDDSDHDDRPATDGDDGNGDDRSAADGER